MAETTTFPILRGTTFTLADDAAAATYTFVLTEGSMSTTNGGHNIVRAQDTNGDYIGPARKGAQAGPSTIQITALMFGAGDSATEAFATDIEHVSGFFASDWDTTDLGSEFIAMTATLAIPDNGAVKGATYVWLRAITQPGSGVEWSREGFKLTMTLESPDSEPAVTINV